MMRKCPSCKRRLFDRGRCYACGYEGLLPPRPHPYNLKEFYTKPMPDFDKLLDQHPVIPMWWNTDLNLDEYLALCEKIKAEHKAKLEKANK